MWLNKVEMQTKLMNYRFMSLINDLAESMSVSVHQNIQLKTLVIYVFFEAWTVRWSEHVVYIAWCFLVLSIASRGSIECHVITICHNYSWCFYVTRHVTDELEARKPDEIIDRKTDRWSKPWPNGRLCVSMNASNLCLYMYMYCI